MHRDENKEAFDAAHLDIDFDCPRPVDEMAFPDLYVVLEIDLLAPGDGIVTDRHHASADRYEADDPQNQIAGQISPIARRRPIYSREFDCLTDNRNRQTASGSNAVLSLIALKHTFTFG